MKAIPRPIQNKMSRNCLLLISPNLLVLTGIRGKGIRPLASIFDLFPACKEVDLNLA